MYLILYSFSGMFDSVVLGSGSWKDYRGLRIQGTSSLPWKDVSVDLSEGDGERTLVKRLYLSQCFFLTNRPTKQYRTLILDFLVHVPCRWYLRLILNRNLSRIHRNHTVHRSHAIHRGHRNYGSRWSRCRYGSYGSRWNH